MIFIDSLEFALLAIALRSARKLKRRLRHSLWLTERALDWHHLHGSVGCGEFLALREIRRSLQRRIREIPVL